MAAVLRAKIQPEFDDSGESVALIAERAKTSTRTVYRVISDPPSAELISLDLADRLLLAAESHLAWADPRIELADGTVQRYMD